MIFGISLVKKQLAGVDTSSFSPKERADTHYQPNTVQKYHKMLNKVFKDKCIMYSILSAFSIEGGFQALWTQSYGKVREICGYFGTRPNRGHFDVRSEHKIRASNLDWMYN